MQYAQQNDLSIVQYAQLVQHAQILYIIFVQHYILTITRQAFIMVHVSNDTAVNPVGQLENGWFGQADNLTVQA